LCTVNVTLIVDDDEAETICCVVMDEWQNLNAGYIALEFSAKHRSKVFAQASSNASNSPWTEIRVPRIESGAKACTSTRMRLITQKRHRSKHKLIFSC